MNDDKKSYVKKVLDDHMGQARTPYYLKKIFDWENANKILTNAY